MDTFSSDSIFVKNVFKWCKSSADIYYQWIKHSSFPSLCIGDNHGTVLESYIILGELLKEGLSLYKTRIKYWGEWMQPYVNKLKKPFKFKQPCTCYKR